MTNYDTALLIHAMRRRERASAVSTGLLHAIQGYYENYTDAIELEPNFISAMETLLEEANIDTDVYVIIRDAERLINETGGIQSDTDGERHQVCTAHVWATVEDFEEEDE